MKRVEGRKQGEEVRGRGGSGGRVFTSSILPLKLAEVRAPLSISMLEVSVTAGGVVELLMAHNCSDPAELPVSSLLSVASMHAKEGEGGKREEEKEEGGQWRER